MKIISLLVSALLVLSLVSVMATQVSGQESESVQIIVGPTPIPDGEAVAENDITLMNEFVAVTIAVGTTPPWGVPNFNIIDAAAVAEGEPQLDTIAQFSFPVNGWGNWPTYTELEIIEDTEERGVIKVTGYWTTIKAETTYALNAGMNYLYINTVLTNEGDEAYVNITSGYAVSFKRGWAFTPGFGTRSQYAAVPKEDVGAFDNWVSGYDEDYMFGLLAPYYTHLSMSTGWVDPFTIHTIEPGETKEFEGYLRLDPVGDTSKALELSIDIEERPSGTVEGNVTTTLGAPIEQPIVVVEKEGRPYCWTVGTEGSYSIKLPPGTYTIYATALDYGVSAEAEVIVEEDVSVSQNFVDVPPPGIVEFTVYREDTEEPLDAKIRIFGTIEPVVRYLTKVTVYTDFDEVGKASFMIAPDTYTFEVSSGGGFVSKVVTLENVSISPEAEEEFSVPIEILVEPYELGWYCADLHHHSDYLDGRTPPMDLVVAQLAASLDFTFVSDHDWVENHEEIAALSEERDVLFIPSVEISPPWGHINVYPLPVGQDVLYRGTASEIFENARALGALVIQANHPYYTGGGYFLSWEADTIPGGYDPGWNVAEINGAWDSEDNLTITKVWGLWNIGERHYLVGNSDVHDVWATPYTGSPRTYAHVEGELTPEAYALSVKQGHSFATYGPLVFPEQMFGETFQVMYGNSFEFAFEAMAVDGLKEVQVISQGKVVEAQTFSEAAVEAQLSFQFLPTEDTWYSLIITDIDGDRAITNPIWVDVVPIEATIDIDPNTLNLKSKGRWITCYIELPPGYNAEDIDVGTIELIVNSKSVPVEPWPTDLGDHDGDGVPDRMVKFSRSAVKGAVGIGEVKITIVGEVEGMPFEGSDIIRIIAPKSSPQASPQAYGVIPEFSAAMLTPLLISLTLVIAILTKATSKKRRRP